MSRIKDCRLPARLEDVRCRFEDWRQSHRARSRIPESLWASAVKMADAYGINRTARALRLDYYSLKKRLKPKAVGVSNGEALATFLEVGPLPPAILGECIVELEDTGGAKLRVHLKGVEAIERAVPELAILARSFRGIRG